MPRGINDARRMAEKTILTKRPGAPVGLRPSPEARKRIQHYVQLSKTTSRRDWPVGMPSDTYAPKSYEE
ncbi:hypothetical protein HN747_04240 [archaeon]|jgi:hypothetical protein|nr:hypothetical protein [archaeon]